MNILSLFDGMGCGIIALKELNFNVETYYASEVDKYAIQQTKLNFPNVIHLGDVKNVNVADLKPIDLLIGGSPCQSFSFAGKRKGMSTKCEINITKLEQYLELKEQYFEFEGQSYLFWEYMRILTDIRKYNPDVFFLLENVEMGAKWKRILSEAIGIYGVHINSALVSAQNRKRIYWTNIKTKSVGLFGELHSDIPQPKDQGILLKDILESEVDEKYYISSKKMLDFVTDEWRLDKKYTQINGEKGLTQMARQYATWCGDYINDAVCVTQLGREDGQQLEPNLTVKTNCLTSVQKDNLVMTENYLQLKGNGFDSDNRFFYENGKHGSVITRDEDKTGVVLGSRIRRLTPTEVSRLQTVPDWYIWACGDTQQYKMCGNGWTIKVIKHIFSFLPQKFFNL